MGKRVTKTKQEKMILSLNKMRENAEKAKELDKELDNIISKLPEPDRKRYYKIIEQLLELNNEFRSYAARLSFLDIDECLLNNELTDADSDPLSKGHYGTGDDPPS